MQRKWKPWHDELLARMWLAEEPIAKIAEAVGFTPRTVLNHKEELGLPRRKRSGRKALWTKDHDRQLERLWVQATQIKSISAEMGFCKQTILDHRRKLGLPPRADEGMKKNIRMTLYFDEEVYSAIGRRAFMRYASKAGYIRALVRRDLGL